MQDIMSQLSMTECLKDVVLRKILTVSFPSEREKGLLSFIKHLSFITILYRFFYVNYTLSFLLCFLVSCSSIFSTIVHL